jgi:hypothetical protein
MRLLWSVLGLTEETRLLDVGGSSLNWELAPGCIEVTMANTSFPEWDRSEDFARLVADGRNLPFAGGSFDVVFTNSVIEHLGDWQHQQRFASECKRVGVRYFVQTPDKGFPIDVHLLMPFTHWLPRWLQVRLMRNFTLRGLITRPSAQECQEFIGRIRLLGAEDLRRLFPDGQIMHERFLGLSKSLVAVGHRTRGNR